LFEKNSFQLRLSGEVTELFPVTTGLREGSVLSPILFSIFISDVEKEVLGPFPPQKFLLQDCVFEGVIVNGLLFADDLVIFARSEECLRARLRLLDTFVSARKLTVNTGKCEIVPFGCHSPGQFQFKFKGQFVPVVSKCKYLGVLFDHLCFLEAHGDSLVTKFQNAVVTFFRLARQLELSDLKTWSILQNSLLFSTLYGSELLNVHQLSCNLEPIFRKALRSYLGLPNQVSNNVLLSLFPDFSVKGLLLKKKCGFLRRMVAPCPTLASVFFIEDRVSSFPRDEGFSFGLRSDLATVGLEELSWSTDKTLVSHAIRHYNDTLAETAWRELSVAKSTRFLCVVFGDLATWHSFLTHAAAVNLASLRLALLTWTGSIGISVTKKKVSFCPFCRARLDSKHYLLCHQEPGFQLLLTSQARNGDFSLVLRYTISTFFRFMFRLRPSILSAEEASTLAILDSSS
jgi:hypothetical protein